MKSMNLLVDDVGTLRKHIKSPFRPSLNMAKKSVERYERDLYHESDLHGDSKPHASPSGFIQLLAIMMIPICVQCTKPPDLTAFSVNPVSVNTGTTGDTVMPHNLITASLMGNLTNNEKVYLATSGLIRASNTRIYSRDGTFRGVINTGIFNIATLVLKDPLKLFTSSTPNLGKLIYTLQTMVNQPAITFALTQNETTGETVNFAVDDDKTSYVIACSAVNIWLYNLTPPAISKLTQLPVGSVLITGLFIDSSTDTYVVGRRTTSIPILRRSDMSLLKNPTISLNEAHLFFELDNLNSNDYLFSFTNGKNAIKYDISSNYPQLHITGNISLSAYGTYNNILNFGPYQYVVTIPQSESPKQYQMVFISKLTWSLYTDTPFIISRTSRISQKSFVGLEAYRTDKYYFGVVDKDSSNFQTYYLLVDNCESRGPTSICETCPPSTFKTNLTAENRCVYADDIPIGFGLNGTDILLQPCGVGCLNCSASFQTCTACDSDNNYYLETGSCLTPDQFPLGRGLENLTKTIQNCQVAGCKNCSHNSSACQSCDTTLNWYLNESTQSCLTPSSFSPGFGVNQSSKTIEACASLGCTDCQNDHLFCAQCNVTAGKYLLNQACYLVENFPPGNGLDSTQNISRECASAGCVDCRQNFSNCSICNNSIDYFLMGSECLLPADFPSTFGLDQVLKVVAPCSSPGCVHCQTDISVCSGCDASSDYFLNGTFCLKPPEISDGFGVDRASNQLATCASVGCLDCRMDKKECHRCDLSNGYVLNPDSKACWTPSSGQGLKLLDNSSQPCSGGCLMCRNNYEICTQCDTAKGYILANSKCLPPLDMQLISTSYDFSTRTASITFSESIMEFETTKWNISLKFLLDKKSHELQKSKEAIISKTTKGFDIVLDVSFISTEASLIINFTDSHIFSSNYDSTYESQTVHVERVRLAPMNNKSEIIGKWFIVFLSSLGFASLVFLTAYNPAISRMMLKLFSNMTYKLYLAGPILFYPDIIFRNANQFSLVPIRGINLFKLMKPDDEQCEVSDVLKRNDAGCNILANYGEDLIVIYCTLLINLIISISWKIVKKKYNIIDKTRNSQNEQNKVNQIESNNSSTIHLNSSSPALDQTTETVVIPGWTENLKSANKYYGIRFFLIMMEGFQLRCLIFCVMNAAYFNLPLSGWNTAGFLTSVLWISSYLALGIVGVKLAKCIWEKLEKIRESGGSKMETTTPLEKSIDIEGERYGFFSMLFDGFETPPLKSELYFPLFTLFRSIGISLCVSLLSNNDVLQLWIVFWIEIGYFFTVLRLNVKASRLEMTSDLFGGFANAFYMLLKLISITNLTEYRRQEVLGVIAASVIIFELVLNSIYLLSTVIVMIVQRIRSLRKSKEVAQIKSNQSLKQMKNLGEENNNRSVVKEVLEDGKEPSFDVQEGFSEGTSQPSHPQRKFKMENGGRPTQLGGFEFLNLEVINGNEEIKKIEKNVKKGNEPQNVSISNL